MTSEIPSTSSGSQTLAVTISHAGITYSLDIAQDSTLSDLKEQLYELTRVPPDVQKLLYRKAASKKAAAAISKADGGDSDSTTSLKGAGIKNGTKIQMLGPTEKELGDMSAADRERRRWEEIMQKRVQAGPTKIRSTGLASASTLNYRFHRIEPLTYLPKPEGAHALLTKLAEDPAIRHVMAKHKFSVGVLTELAPHENPGLLGLNVNAGQAIKLRLRTDRYDGFRLYSEVRRVLCHELTHNVWSDHDDNFKQLNSQLNREVVEYEFAAQEGTHNLGYEGPAYEPQSTDIHSHTLGGPGGAAVPESVESRRQRLLDAVMARLKKDEQDVEDTCGTAGPGSL